MKSEYTVYADLTTWQKLFPDAPAYIVCQRGKGLIDQYATIETMTQKYPDIKEWEEPKIDFCDKYPRNYTFAKYLHWRTDEANMINLYELIVDKMYNI